ncbi:MAG: hypothetical protein U0457_19965 [Candidatus Sericytochromatia bacterium]
MSWEDELKKIIFNEKFSDFDEINILTGKKLKKRNTTIVVKNIEYDIKYEVKAEKEIFSPYLFSLDINIYQNKNLINKGSQYASFQDKNINNEKLKKIFESLLIAIEEDSNIRIKKNEEFNNKENNPNNKKHLEKKIKLIENNIKKKYVQIIFICRITRDRYIDVRKNIETNKLSVFNSDFKDFSRAIFSYWYGDKNKTPNSLKREYSNSKFNFQNLKDDNLYYYQVKFEIEDDKELIDLLTNKNAREREKGLEIISEKGINYKYSELFNELPDDCIMF